MGKSDAFSKKAVSVALENIESPYGDLVQSKNPYLSLLKYNPWMTPPAGDEALRWGKGLYYDTTVARKHGYWRDKGLPQPTQDAQRLYNDFLQWGYCLIESGLSPEQTAVLHARVSEQAAAERALGIAYMMEAQQSIWALFNKGDVFVRCLTHEPDVIQAGPLIEGLLDKALGEGWQHYNLSATISYPDCHPQVLHQDQLVAIPYTRPDIPALVNVFYILQDINECNGGTLIVPGSHRAFAEGDGEFGELPPAINLEVPAGTVMLKDGRLLHGGAVNKTNKLRYVMTNPVVKPFIRPQEAMLLSLHPDIVKSASDKLLYRCGFQATALNSSVEGFGVFGNGRQGDSSGAIAHARIAMDEGHYDYVRELTVNDAASMKAEDFTLGKIQIRNEAAREKARVLGHEVDAKLKDSR